MTFDNYASPTSGISRRSAIKAIGAVGLTGSALLSAESTLAQGMFINPLEERPLGLKAYPKFVGENGGVHPNSALVRYVAEIGLKLARTTAKFAEQMVFTTLNNSEPNAFASMGGFVYLQSGYFPWFNDEAELASTLGHEIGHAVKRHVAHQANREAVANRLMALRAMRRPGEMEAMKERASLKIYSFSREQEAEADSVGVGAIAKLGYDPYAMATKHYQNLLREGYWGKLGYGNNTPIEQRTHPLTEDRIRNTITAAESTGVKPNTAPRNQDQFFSMIDGLLLQPTGMFGKSATRIKVIAVKPTDTVQSLARLMAPGVALKPDLLMAINGMDNAAELNSRKKIKLIVAA